LEGFILTHSIGGGTGSGFVSHLLYRLTDSYSKKAKINFTVYPSMGYGGIVEPYNAVLATDNLLQHSSLVTIFDNQALYRIMSQSLNIENPNYSSINRLIAQVISSFTSPSRFSGITHENINGFLTNLVPYHRIKFVFPSFAPMLPI
jgi:tubulin alpha